MTRYVAKYAPSMNKPPQSGCGHNTVVDTQTDTILAKYNPHNAHYADKAVSLLNEQLEVWESERPVQIQREYLPMVPGTHFWVRRKNRPFSDPEIALYEDGVLKFIGTDDHATVNHFNILDEVTVYSEAPA